MGYNDDNKFGGNAYDPFTKSQSIATTDKNKAEKKKPID
jgi:hypothetical protein